MIRRFWGNVIQHHVNETRIILNEKKDTQLAKQGGSNEKLVNSFLPLLGERFTLITLFEHALHILDEQICHKGVWYKSQRVSDIIFAYIAT